MFATKAIAFVSKLRPFVELAERALRGYNDYRIGGAAFLVKSDYPGGKGEKTRKITPWGYKWVPIARVKDVEWDLMKKLGYEINPDLILTEFGWVRERWQACNLAWWKYEIGERLRMLPDGVLVSVEVEENPEPNAINVWDGKVGLDVKEFDAVGR